MKLDKEQLIKYFEGKLSGIEKEAVDQFLQSHPDSNDELDQLFDHYWEHAEDKSKDEVFSDVLFSEIKSKIQPKEKSKVPLLFKYAAVILMMLASTFVMFHYIGEGVVEESAMMIKTTSAGQKSTIILSDGSKVYLNSNSQLKYPENFSDYSREIELTGEAFFEVVKDRSRPFSVTANEVTTTALGTSFNINSREGATKVSLATGKVVIEKEDQKQYFLLPGQAYFNSSDGIVTSEFDFKADLSWKDGVLYFNDTEFDQVIKTLESWYDVSIEIDHVPQENKSYTGQFEGEPLSRVLDNMGFTLGFNYFLNERKVKLIFN